MGRILIFVAFLSYSMEQNFLGKCQWQYFDLGELGALLPTEYMPITETVVFDPHVI